MQRIMSSAGLFFAFISGACAATVEITSGTASANSGSGFKQIGSGASVPPGSSVMVSPGSSARIVYANGCAVPVDVGQVTIVAFEDPVCAVEGAAAGGANYGMVAVGVLAVGGVAAGVALLASDNDKPASGQ